MTKHIFKGLAALLAAILVTMFTAVPVLAAELRQGDSVTIGRDEVIDDDLYVAGGEITVDGTINGDLIAAGGTITVNGTVNGSVMAAGGTVNISGEVSHAVRAAGGTLNIGGDVNGDLVVAGGEVNIDDTAKIGGDLLLGAGTARIDGLIEGDVKGGGGEVTITNGVKGDIKLEVDRLTIASTADIQGNLNYVSENEADIQSGAQIGGTTTHKLPEAREPIATPFAGVGGRVIGFMMALVAGIIVILIAPRRTQSITESIRSKPWPSLGWGALILFATPIAALVVFITIIGIPVALIGVALYVIAIYLAQVFVGLLIGQLIIGQFREVKTKAILIGALALGLAILSLLRLIPYLGFVIGLVIAVFGLGALLVSERRLRAEAAG